MHTEEIDKDHLKSTFWRNLRVRQLYAKGFTHSEIARRTGINSKTISSICAVLGLRRAK